MGVEIRIADNDDAEVPTGTVGELLIRGDLVMTGYWRRPELTRQNVRDGWLHSGDLGYRDEDGFIYIVDRKKGAVLSSSDIIEHCRIYVGGYKCPKSVTIRYEGLPKSGAGKILKKALREELASQSELA